MGVMASVGEILLSSAPGRTALFTRIIAFVDGGADDEFSPDTESADPPLRVETSLRSRRATAGGESRGGRR